MSVNSLTFIKREEKVDSAVLRFVLKKDFDGELAQKMLKIISV